MPTNNYCRYITEISCSITRSITQLSSLTTIPEDQMVTVQEEVITTVDDSVPKVQPVVEEVMDEG